MAGTQRGSRSPSSGHTTPVRISPRESINDSFDLLTGTFPPVSSNPFVVDAGGGRNGIRGAGGATSSTSPVQLNPNSVVGGMSFNTMQYQQQQQPMDLLTGIFPPPASPPPNLVVPADVVAKQDAWKKDRQVHSSAGGFSTEYFATTPIAAKNPFVDNVENSNASCSVSPPYAIPRDSDAATEMSSHRNRNMSRPVDGSFAKFTSVTDNISNLDLGSRSRSLGTAGPLPCPSPQSRSNRSFTGSKIIHTNSFNNFINNHKYGGSVINSYSTDSSYGIESMPKQSSLPSGIGLERLQQTSYPRAETPRTTTASDENSGPPGRAAPGIPAYQGESTRRSTSEPMTYQREPSLNISVRAQGKAPLSMDPRTPGSAPQAIVHEEFVGANSGKAIYRAPRRGAVHPSRPVSLELRPHPLRGAPPNPVTRLTCFNSSVWAACELGIMVWEVENATGRGSAGNGNNLGDEDAASYEFLRLQGSSTTSLAADVANMVVWTGHRDGKIRLWSARPSTESDPSSKRESRSPSLVFQAHRFTITALVITSYGELWAGFDTGELKAWPWEAVAKAMSGVGDGASYMEKSYVELRIRNIGVGPNGPISPEIRFLVADHANGRVWCGGAQYIALWDARTRDFLRMFGGPTGQADLTSLDAGSPGKEILSDEDLRVGYAKVGKKEKGGWLQRSRNAVMGAADAVRRAASGGGQSSDDGRRLEALVAAADGTMWGGYGSGLLVQWDWQGNRLQEILHRNVVIRSMCSVGNRLWVGYADGKLQVLPPGNAGTQQVQIGSWHAHRLSVIQLAVCDGYVFSLGTNGSIRGWNVSSPDRNLDGMLKSTMSNRADSYTRQRNLLVLAATWNTAQEKASVHSIRTWLGFDPTSAQPPEASIVVVGLQEVEMGAGAIGMAAVKETVRMGLQEKGSQTGQWWLTQIDASLGEGKYYERIGSRQLAGMLVGVWVRRNLLPYVGEVEAGAVACGFGRALGNKGGVGVKMMIFRRTICVLTSHLAAHMEQVSRRNADFEHIYNQMSFGRSLRINVTAAAAGVSSAVQNMLRGGHNNRRITTEQGVVSDGPLSPDSDPTSDDAPELADADLLIWTGDLNYRIDNMSYEETLSLIKKKAYDILLSADQLRIEMASGRTFHGMREGHIKFPPTYKFDKGYDVYDTSEKKRIPAWCDRVLFRDSFDSGTDPSYGIKLTRPIKATVLSYEAIMQIEDSDHKPVRCLLNVDLSVIDETARRREYGEVMRDPNIQSCIAALGYTPDSMLNTNRVFLDDVDTSSLILENTDRQHRILYVVQCEALPSRDPCPCGEHSTKDLLQRNASLKDGLPRAGYGFPHWLVVSQAAGVVAPGQSIPIRIKYVMRPNGSDQQDKVVVVVVRWKGALSSRYKQHRVCVCHGPSVRSILKEKENSRVRLYDQQRRPAYREKEPPYPAKPDYPSSSFTHSTPDLLL